MEITVTKQIINSPSLPCRLESTQILFVIVAVVMALYAIVLTVFGYLATGATRQNIYSGAKCIMGGRVAAGFVSILFWPTCLIMM